MRRVLTDHSLRPVQLPGTIHTAVEEIERIGQEEQTDARGLAIQMDVRDAAAVDDAIGATVDKFGGLDIVVNNASAINLTPTERATVKSYDLMHAINARATYCVARAALPHLLASHQNASTAWTPNRAHILTLSPPLADFRTISTGKGGCWPGQFAKTGAAYTMSKMGMSLMTLALAAETRGKVGVNSLWPATLIGTSAMRIVNPKEGAERGWRSPEIVAEAAGRIFEQDASTFTGNFVIDELFLRQHGFTRADLAKFSLGGEDIPFDKLSPDLYISKELDALLKAMWQADY